MLKHRTSEPAIPVSAVTLGLLLAWSAVAAPPAEAANGADVVFADVPSEIEAGESAQVLVTVKNTGTATWRASSLHRLGATSSNQVGWGTFKCGGYSNSITDQRAFLCGDVPPNGTQEFNFRISVPDGASGSVRLGVQMVQDGVEWFGSSQTFTIQVAGGGSDNGAQFLPGDSDVPDDMEAGDTEDVRIRVRNAGSTTWRASSNHRLGAESSGSDNEVRWRGFECGGYMNDATDGRVFLCNDVPPGATYDFHFQVEMPSSASSSRRLAVRMVQDGVEWFGPSQSWTIDVEQGPPPPPDCATVPLATPDDRWKLEIWDNQAMSGAAVEERYDAAGTAGFAFDWAAGRPSSCVGNDGYAVRFSRRAHFPDAATYTFTTTTDDGVRLWVDGVLLIDRWQGQSRTSYTATRTLAAGWHDLRMDYFEAVGQAYAGLSWVASTSPGACPAGEIDLADYLLGSPEVRIHVRHENGGTEHFAYRTGGTVDGLNQHFLIKSPDGVSWEELGLDDDFLYRNRDTSWSALCNEGNTAAYYLLREEGRERFARLAPRCMAVGESWSSDTQSYVDGGFRTADRCDLGCTSQYEGWITLEARVVARHATFTTTQGLAIHELPGNPDVIEFVTAPFNDHFWLARGIGMIQFEGPNPNGAPFRSGAFQIDFDQPPATFVGLCGEEIAQRSFHVDPGATAPLVADVPAGQRRADFATAWPGSDIVMTVTSPSGRVITRGTVAPDVQHQLGPTSEVYTLTNPEAGPWQVALFGAVLPAGGEEVGFSLTTIPSAPPDATPPVLTPTVTGVAGANGWYVSEVKVEWSFLDLESGVPVTSGCQPRTLSAETAGTLVTCSATNGAGLSSSSSIAIRIDRSPPSVVLAVSSGTPGANGWFTSDVVVRTQGEDAVSGIASCTPDHVQTQETAGTVLNGACTNGAGLAAQAAPLTLRVDKTPPLLAGERNPAPNAAGWNNGDVTVTFQCQDAVSGVAVPPLSPQVVGTEGANQSASATCTDAAGLAAAATVGGISIDKTAPALSILSPHAAEYFVSAEVPVSWTASELLSGIQSETAALDRTAVVNGQVVRLKRLGRGDHTLLVEATDVAGNRGEATVVFDVLTSLPKAAAADWPLGTCGDGDLVLGRDVEVVHGFGNATHPVYGPRAHTGLDLRLRGGSTAGAVVYAAADGVFECASEPGAPGSPGRALVLEHKLAEGGRVYTQYGNLEEHFIDPGQIVRRGDPIGRVLDQDAAQDTHLHFEVRRFASWEEGDCAGPGYAPEGSTPERHRWLDPVPFYYTHRPSHPASVVTWSHPEPLPVRAKPRHDAAEVGVFPPSTRFTAVGVEADACCSSDRKCSSWWYRLKSSNGRSAFVNAYREGDYGDTLAIGEPRRAGGGFKPAPGRLLVDYRFDDPAELGQGLVSNAARPGRRDGTIVGGATPAPGASGGAEDTSLQLDGETASVEVQDSRSLRFPDGLEVDAFVARESSGSDDTIASHGGQGGPWRLALSADGALVFEVELEGGRRVRVEHRVPECAELGRWVHVAARYEPEHGLRLYWNGNLVAKKGAGEQRLARARSAIRVGDGGSAATRFHGRIDSLRISELKPHEHRGQNGGGGSDGDCDD